MRSPRRAPGSSSRAVRQFCDFLTNPAYDWGDVCLRHFRTHPVQVVYDWNAAAHADEAEGEPERRAFTRSELEAFFDHADEEVLRVRGKGRKGSLLDERPLANNTYRLPPAWWPGLTSGAGRRTGPRPPPRTTGCRCARPDWRAASYDEGNPRQRALDLLDAFGTKGR